MEIIKNNKVLVIDDMYEEVSPIIRALATEGVSTIYWDGTLENKPRVPLQGIRFVFLDMRLSTLTDAHSINVYLFKLLQSAISNKNGPYILLIWSKHDNEYLDSFKSEFATVSGVPKPYLIINMEKNNFIQRIYSPNELYSEIAATLENEGKSEIKDEILKVLQVNNINERSEIIQLRENITQELLSSLDKNLKQVNSLAVLLIWENLVNTSAKNLVNNITGFSELNENWDNNIKTLIRYLAMANAGKSLETTDTEYVNNALSALNQMLPDELWNQLNESNIDEEIFDFVTNSSITKTIEDDTYSISKDKKKYVINKNGVYYNSFKHISELGENINIELCRELYIKYLSFLGKGNFKLLCERIVSNQRKKPGNLYAILDEELLKDLCDSILKETDTELFTKVKLVKLDISSSCDYAQNKLKRIRILPGIIVGEDYFSAIHDTEDIFCTPELEINNKVVKIAFNFHFINNDSRERLTELDAIFSFRELLLYEIKHKLASYISRIGIINL